MSYNVSLYTNAVKVAVLAGSDLEDLQNIPIPDEILSQFKMRIEKFGYKIESTNATCNEYIHPNPKWAIQVVVFKTQIAFSIPYWDDSENAIMDALMTAHEIADDLGLSVYDPQTNGWGLQNGM
jgi:hypothetical protein